MVRDQAFKFERKGVWAASLPPGGSPLTGERHAGESWVSMSESARPSGSGAGLGVNLHGWVCRNLTRVWQAGIRAVGPSGR